MKKSVFLIAFIFAFFNLIGQSNSPLDYNPKVSNYKVISQMNYCINAMTNIINNQSMDVLQKESDRLRNNLTITEVVDIPEIQHFRTKLMNATANFEINEEEKLLTKRVTSLKRDIQKWDALSNALSSPMILTQSSNLAQGVFYSLLTVARTAVEYKKTSGELDIEELKAMWLLRKDNLVQIRDLRTQAFNYTTELFKKYHLSENDRLTEKDVESYSLYLSEPNHQKRLRQLLDNGHKLYVIPSYYYHVGMTYLDLKQYDKAKPYFDKYLDLYSKAPIFRYDEMSGCIALAKLSNEKNLPLQTAENLINIALKNLPNNSAASLQCALFYITKYKKVDKGLNILRAGIDNPESSDKELLLMAAAKLLPQAKIYPHYSELKKSIEDADKLDITTYLTYAINSDASWNQIQKKIQFSNEDYRNLTLIGTHLNNRVETLLDPKIVCNPTKIGVYIETHSDGEINIRQLSQNLEGSFTIDEIYDVPCFKANKDKGLAYIFVEAIVPNNLYVLKKDLNLNEIKEQKFQGRDNFSLIESDFNDIVEFCEEHPRSDGKTKLISSPNKNSSGSLVVKSSIQGNASLLALFPTYQLTGTSAPKITFVGDVKSAYLPFHSTGMKGDYLRIRLIDGTSIMYKYNEDVKKLVPYLYVTICDGKPKFSYTSLAISEETNRINIVNAPWRGGSILFVGDDDTNVELKNTFFNSDNGVKKEDLDKIKY